MAGILVICESCRRSFNLAVDASPYLLLELQSRPCPFCEAYTLGARVTGAPDGAQDSVVRAQESKVRRHWHRHLRDWP